MECGVLPLQKVVLERYLKRKLDYLLKNHKKELDFSSVDLDGSHTPAIRGGNQVEYQAENIKQLIHHSDSGIQYCSNQYTQILKRNNIKISMTQENHCYENAIAERINGILKDEFYLNQTFDSVAHAKRATKNAINLYNQIRLHVSLDYKTPEMAYKFTV